MNEIENIREATMTARRVASEIFAAHGVAVSYASSGRGNHKVSKAKSEAIIAAYKLGVPVLVLSKVFATSPARVNRHISDLRPKVEKRLYTNDEHYFRHLPKREKKCLKCRKVFITDVNCLCRTCNQYADRNSGAMA